MFSTSEMRNWKRQSPYRPSSFSVLFLISVFSNGCSMHTDSKDPLVFCVTTLCFSPDGKQLVAGGGGWNNDDPGVVYVWDTSNWHRGAVLNQGFPSNVRSITFSHDGTFLVTTSSRVVKTRPPQFQAEIQQWNVNTWNNIAIWDGHSHNIDYIMLSRDDKLLASSDTDGVVKLWNMAKKREVILFRDPKQRGAARRIPFSQRTVFSTDDTVIVMVAADAQGLLLWDIATRKLLDTLSIQDHVISMAMSSSNKLAACCEEGTIHLFDITTRKHLTSWQAHQDHVYSLLFTPDGNTLVSGSLDSTVILWNIRTPPIVKKWQIRASSGVTTLAISPSGDFLAVGSCVAGRPPDIRIWNIVKENEIIQLK